MKSATTKLQPNLLKTRFQPEHNALVSLTRPVRREQKYCTFSTQLSNKEDTAKQIHSTELDQERKDA
jgi:hypothetical protein